MVYFPMCSFLMRIKAKVDSNKAGNRYLLPTEIGHSADLHYPP